MRCPRSLRTVRVLAWAAGSAVAVPALANDWTAGPGFWNTGANWAGGVPGNGQTANIIHNDVTDRTVTYDYNLAPITIAGLTLDQAGSGTNRINQSAFRLAASGEIIGNSGRGIYNQTGGTNIVTNFLSLGEGASGIGFYNLSGGTLSTFGNVVGLNGQGTFNHSGSAVYTTTELWLSANSTASVGIYNMSNLASLNVTQEVVGRVGIGVFNQTGGTHTVVGSGGTNALMIGEFANSSGSFNLSGGTLTTKGTQVGIGGNGAFTHSGGTHTVNTSLRVAPVAGKVGTYTLGGNAVLNSPSTVLGGAGGTAIFNQSGGVHNVSGTLTLNSGTYSLSGTGMLNANVVNNTNFVYTGGSYAGNFVNSGKFDATFTDFFLSNGFTNSGTVNFNRFTMGSSGTTTASYRQTGGTAHGDYLIVGADGPASVSISAGLLSVARIRVAEDANGTFNHSGGTVRVIGEGLEIGYNVAGVYSMSNSASLDSDATFVGVDATGTFNQTGGTHFSGELTLGVFDGEGTYNLSGGTLETFDTNLGDFGTAAFNHSAGTHTVESLNIIADTMEETAVYTLTGSGVLDAERVDVRGDGLASFNQSGGLLDARSVDVGGSGRVNLSGGVFDSSFTEVVSKGVFIHSGGTHTSLSLSLSAIANQTASYTLSGNGVLDGGETTIGLNLPSQSGASIFTQTGGRHTVTGSLIIAPGNNTYILSGGLLSASMSNSATFIYNGGTFTGTISNGGVFNANAPFVITGTFNQTAGAVNGTLVNNGVFNYHGGAFNAAFTNNATLNANVPLAISGAFTQNAGVANGPILNNGVFTYNGGTLTGSIVNSGTFNASAPFTNIGSFTQQGGIANGALINNGAMTYNGGVISGPLTNNGTFTANAPFSIAGAFTNSAVIVISAPNSITANGGFTNSSLGEIVLNGGTLNGAGLIVNTGMMRGFGTVGGSGGFTNNFYFEQDGGNLTFAGSGNNRNLGTIKLEAGRQLALTGSGLTNVGSIQMNDGQIVGPATLRNDAGGVIIGPGRISAPFSNEVGGTVVSISGQLNFTSAFTNAGNITLGSVAASLVGSTITNTGVIQGVGSVANHINNTTGVIKPMAGSLQLNTLTNAGTILLPAGSDLLVSAGLATNAGAINLIGGTFDNNARPMRNNGSITGHGALRAGSMTNAGTLSASGGVLDVFTPIANTAAGKMIITGGSTATFYGNVSGTVGTEIRVSTNSAAVFLAPVSGPITFTGTGAKYFEAGVSATGPVAAGGVTVVNEGATLTTDHIRESALTIDGQLTIRPGSLVSRVNTLTIDPAAQLDISNNAMIVDYAGDSPGSAIRAGIISGFASGAWAGPGITSSTAAGQPNRLAVGYGEASQIFGISGTSTATFLGETVDATVLLLRMTIRGDLNLDGQVGFVDLLTVAANFGASGGQIPWNRGDINYDGQVGFVDLLGVAAQFGEALPASIPGASAEFNEALAAIAAGQVPEPGAALIVAGASAALFGRRRRLT